jgi:hypothetical protein
MRAAAPSQGANFAPLGGSVAANAASVGGHVLAAGPTQGARPPLGGSRETTSGGI